VAISSIDFPGIQSNGPKTQEHLEQPHVPVSGPSIHASLRGEVTTGILPSKSTWPLGSINTTSQVDSGAEAHSPEPERSPLKRAFLGMQERS
jgi:hypothetical protein